MPVDPRKTRRVLVVHGVQLGDDNGLNQHRQVNELIQARLGGIPLRYDVDLYRYENINDEAQQTFSRLVSLMARTPAGNVLGNSALDLVGDVVINLADGSTAATIREGLKAKILDYFDAGEPCYVLAHSLGSIYAFDVIRQLMRSPDFFDRASRRSWPVQGLLTIGSPIGLGMFRVAGRRKVSQLGEGTKWFRWVNYWDRTDPVVSGSLFGKQLPGQQIAEKYLTSDERQGWAIHDRAVDTGKVWLLSHVAYWENPMVGDGLVNMLTN